MGFVNYKSRYHYREYHAAGELRIRFICYGLFGRDVVYLLWNLLRGGGFKMYEDIISVIRGSADRDFESASKLLE